MSKWWGKNLQVFDALLHAEAIKWDGYIHVWCRRAQVQNSTSIEMESNSLCVLFIWIFLNVMHYDFFVAKGITLRMIRIIIIYYCFASECHSTYGVWTDKDYVLINEFYKSNLLKYMRSFVEMCFYMKTFWCIWRARQSDPYCIMFAVEMTLKMILNIFRHYATK